MEYRGTLNLVDKIHVSSFNGFIEYVGYIECSDTTHQAPMTGYVVSDSSRLPSDQTYFQDTIIGRGDMTLSLKDWTYAHGHLNIDGTYVDGTFGYIWRDPVWIYHSLWCKNKDTSEWSLEGYKYREPVRQNVGEYYISTVIPSVPGQYENRWLYLKDNSGSYAKEVVQPLTSLTKGID